MTETHSLFKTLANQETSLLPSGLKVTYIEQNASHDSIISKSGDVENGDSFINFLAEIIVSTSESKEAKLSPLDVMRLKLSDKYYLLVCSRLFSLGSELVFKHICENDRCGKENEYVEDLNNYTWKKTKPEDIAGAIDPYEKYRIKPYPNGLSTEREITTSSGRKFKYSYLTSMGEKSMLEVPRDSININHELTSRNLSWWDETKGIFLPISLQELQYISAKEVNEIRTDIGINDPQFMALSELKCPYCRKSQLVPLVSVNDFFYPRVI